MKAASFDYARPLNSVDAIRLVTPTDGMAKFVSGSQSLGPMMNLRLAQPEMLVDLRGIPALRECRAEGNTITLGACITHAEIEDGKVVDGTEGLMPHVARGIAYRAVRNRGTLGGSLAHADPAADWITTLRVLDADFLVAGPAGERLIANARALIDTSMPDAHLEAAGLTPGSYEYQVHRVALMRAAAIVREHGRNAQ
jgi:carbon-monoxide dehydrogenase medium subunit